MPITVKWVGDIPPQEIRSPHAGQGREGLQTKSEQPQYIFHRGGRQQKSRMSFEQAIRQVSDLARPPLQLVYWPTPASTPTLSWALPGKVVA